VATCKKILVVEDNEDCRELQACVIKRLGYVVIEADNGLAAIDQALATHPDLILMDLSMPKMGGDEATVRLKTQPSTKDIPVIICTAFGPGPYVNQALDAGAAEILHKPFKFADLEKLLRRHIPSEENALAAGGK
jgi:CheY-like chemotaxis protein